MRYFILGNHPGLSIAEIAAVFPESKDFSLCSADVCMLDVPTDMPRVERLGGVVKSGTILTKTTLDRLEGLADMLAKAILAKSGDARAVYGISVHSLAQGAPIKPVFAKVQRLGLEIKKRVKAEGKAARFVSSRTPDLPSVAIQTNHLLDLGGEFVLLVTNNKIFVGQTDFVQDFAAWSNRDFNRPARDAKSGMLPPKLARIMVNLTGANPATSHIVDPFCGSGTILMEAGLIGYKQISGFDISEKAVKDSIVNMQWIIDKIAHNLPMPRIEVADARTMHERVKNVDAVAAETYLGPPLTRPQAPALKIQEGLTALAYESFSSIAQAIKPTTHVVAAFPCWRENDQFVFLPLKKQLERAGFEILRPLPATIPSYLSHLTASGGLLYARPDAAVGREIFVLRRRT